jgi:hypothetical protein
MSAFPEKKHKPINTAFRPKGFDGGDELVLDDATRKMLMQDLHRAHKPSGPVATAGTNTGAGAARKPTESELKESGDLMTVMASRLNALEKRCELQKKEISDLHMKLISATDHLAEEKRRRVKAESDADAAIDELAQIHVFLSDYGLTWVGNHSAAGPSSREVSPESETGEARQVKGPALNLYDGGFQPPQLSDPDKVECKEYTPTLVNGPTVANAGGGGIKSTGSQAQDTADTGKPSLPFDLERLKRNAKKLSGVAGATEVSTNGQRAVIKSKEAVTVVVWRNGLVVNNGPLRPYGWPLCDAFLNDLMDGFFPYEYKDKYPDGFPIDVTDRSMEDCPVATSSTGSNANPNPQGAGQKLGRGPAPNSNFVTLQSQNPEKQKAADYKPLTAEQLLAKLPEQRITPSGKIINVRDEVGQFVGAPPLVQAASALAGGGQPGHPLTATVKGGTEPQNEAPEVKVQVRMPQGQRVLLHMKLTDTVADLRAELLRSSSAFFKPQPSGFDLCTVLPKRQLSNLQETMKEAGLAPSCALFVMSHQPAKASA